MQARQLPIQRGWAWLYEAVMLWRRNPALLTFAAFGYLLILVFISAVPLIGQPVASLLMPVFSLGVLNTCRAIDEGRKAGPDILFSGFKTNLPTLVTIGGIYLIASILVLLLTMAVDGGALMKLLTGAATIDAESVDAPNLTFSMLVALTLSIPVIMGYWFAPILAGWWNCPAPKAIVFSFVACARNWRPFLSYGIGVTFFGFLIPTIVASTLGLLVPFLSTVLFLLLPLVLVPILFASFYINAREIFGTDADDRDIT